MRHKPREKQISFRLAAEMTEKNIWLQPFAFLLRCVFENLQGAKNVNDKAYFLQTLVVWFLADVGGRYYFLYYGLPKHSLLC